MKHDTLNNFSDDELRKIIIPILTKEFNDNNLDYKFSVGPFSLLEKVVKSNKVYTRKEKKNFLRTLGDDTIAYHSETRKTIIVFSDRIRKFKTLEKQLFVTLFSCYHEVRHALQKRFDEFSYEKFLFDMEDIYREINAEHYINNHDSYSFEIGADLYAMDKTMKMINLVYPKVYEKEKAFIDGMKKRIMDNYFLYDGLFFIKTVTDLIEESGVVPDNKVLKMFYNEDGTVKKVNEITSEENYEKLDKRIVYSIFSSCLNNISLKDESKEGLLLLKRSNEYTLELSLNQDKYLSKNKK